MTSFWLALQFLTRIPVAPIAELEAPVLGRSVLFYPLVGLIIGGILFFCAYLLSGFPNAQLQAALLVLIWVLLTGGLHLDGLADCADAWAGGLGSRQRSLEIMQDSCAGPAAVLSLIFIVLLKWLSLIPIIEMQFWPLLFAAPVLGRSAILGLMLTTPYVREQGLGATIVQQLPRNMTVAVLFLVLGLVMCWVHIPVLLSVLLVWWLLRNLACKRLGGVTGDVYGASVEVVEVAVLATGSLYI